MLVGDVVILAGGHRAHEPVKGLTAGPKPPTWAEVIDLEDPRGLGRIRVRYHWPVAKPADAESSWLDRKSVV